MAVVAGFSLNLTVGNQVSIAIAEVDPISKRAADDLGLVTAQAEETVALIG